jgi:hypothetical protein
LSFKAKSSCDASQLTQHQKIAKKLLLRQVVKLCHRKTHMRNLVFKWKLMNFAKKQSLVMYINYGQDMNNYGFFLAKIHTKVTKQSPV